MKTQMQTTQIGAMILKNKKIPMRRCAGCMESKPKSSMIRVACYEGSVSVDPGGKAKGRGVYICPKRECAEKAHRRRALQRSFGIEIPPERLEEIFEELMTYEQKGD